MERSSKASSVPADNAVATDIENDFSVARCVYVNILGVLSFFWFFFFFRKKVRLFLGNAASRYFSASFTLQRKARGTW